MQETEEIIFGYMQETEHIKVACSTLFTKQTVYGSKSPVDKLKPSLKSKQWSVMLNYRK